MKSAPLRDPQDQRWPRSSLRPGTMWPTCLKEPTRAQLTVSGLPSGVLWTEHPALEFPGGR